MKFKKIELHAFRAYKDKENATFDFMLENNEIANFISIYAPNGFGKTSFYDGVEWGMTKNIRRLMHQSEIAKAERGIVKKIHQKPKKQNVLKNKYVDENIQGYVSLLTTRNNNLITNIIPELPRSDSTDFNLLNESTTENKYFRNVILSQDAIDAFLTEDNAKDRYKRFIDYFGDKDIEQYYLNLNNLIKSNEINILKLKKDLNDIQTKLETPIDKEVFNNVIVHMAELNKMGENLININDQFDQTQKLQFDDQINKRKIQLLHSLDEQNKFKEILLNKMTEIDSYFERNSKLDKIEKEIKTFHMIQETAKIIESIKEKINIEKTQQIYLNELKNDYPTYTIIHSEVASKHNEVTKYKITLLNTENELKQIYNQTAQILEQKKTITNSLMVTNELVNNAPEIFKNIENLNNLILTTKELTKGQPAQAEKFKKQVVSLQENEKRLTLIIHAIKENIFLDIRENEKYKATIATIEVLIVEQELYDKQLADMVKEEKNYQKFNSELKSLVLLGSTLINNNHLKTCPLCNQSYEEYDDLLAKVLNNTMLNDIEKNFLIKRKNIENSILILKNKINEHQQILYTELNSEMKIIQQELKSVEYSLKQIEQDILQHQISLQKLENEHQQLLIKTEKLSQDEFLLKYKNHVTSYKETLNLLDQEQQKLEIISNDKKNQYSLTEVILKALGENIIELKNKVEWEKIEGFKKLLSSESDVINEINTKIKISITNLNNYFLELKKMEDTHNGLLSGTVIYTTDNLQDHLTNISYEKEMLEKDMQPFLSYFKIMFEKNPIDKKTVEEVFHVKRLDVDNSINLNKKKLEMFEILQSYGNTLILFVEQKNLVILSKTYQNQIELKMKVEHELNEERKKVEEKINIDVQSFFHEELINKLYEKIDPHPDFKKITFECTFDKDGGKLNIFINNSDGNEPISPALYYSTAQLNILSLSIFLAKALNVQDENGYDVDCIFIDDPVQSMDSINVLSTIDLLRSLVVNHNKQIILSTHDENFHMLLQKKIPIEQFGSKFIELETFGKIKKEI